MDATRFVNYSWGRYDLKYYKGRCGYIKDEKIKGRVTVFLSGKMISTGARSIQESIHQLERAMELMVMNNFVRSISLSPAVQNIVATVSLLSRIDLKAVATCVSKVTYEPDQFPGAILRTKEGPVCLLFASGKIVIVGSSSEEQLLVTFNHT